MAFKPFQCGYQNNSLFVKAFYIVFLPTTKLYLSNNTQLRFIYNSIVYSVFIHMWMFTGAYLYPCTTAVMCSPPLISFPLLCPSLSPWHQLWQDKTVVVCLPVYTCCADLLLLYSRHRQADRWQPHWHQNRMPLLLTSVKLDGFIQTVITIWRDKRFSFLLNYLSTSHLPCCFKMKYVSINLWQLKRTAVFWLFL